MSTTETVPPGDKVYLDAAYVSVRWVSAGRWVQVEWKAWANSPEYRAAHETVLLALRENRASKNLIDAMAARVISDADQRWLIEDWIPRAIAAGRRWTAVVLPKSALGRTISENIDKRPHPDRTKVQYFQTVAEAAGWLATVN
ncbi:MAG: hypothetical protein M3003_05965 [Candidatus Dormibacteraeota bacterium]|nr:hypothetical protein [Candidatus Dormibacteraeota bacterium]